MVAGLHGPCSDPAQRFFAMTKPQRSHFFGRLWPAACEAQGWDAKDDLTRRAVCLRVTGKRSMTSLSESEITALFAEVRHLADPLDFDKARLASDPELAEEVSARARVLFAIDQMKLADAFIEGLARNIVRARGVANWRCLNSADLRWLVVTLSARSSAADETF